MKTSAAVIALLGSANAGYSVHVNIDEKELARAAEDVSDTIDKFVQDNAQDIIPVAQSIQNVAEDHLTRKLSSDNIRVDALVKFMNALKAMAYPDPATCDEEAFAQCLVDDEAVDLFTWGPPTMYDMFQLFDTACADTYGCNAPCIKDEYGEKCNSLGQDFMPTL